MSQIAVIKTGGKQYIVSPGQKIKIEKLPQQEGEDVVFEEVLLTEKDGKIEIGTPLLKHTKVKGKVISHGKGKKRIVFTYKAKKRERRKKGHRQPYTEVEITEIA